MNAWINTPETIRALGLKEVNFMYPGDTIDASNLSNPGFQSGNAIQKYMQDLEQMVIDPSPPAKTWEEITEAVSKNVSYFQQHIMLPFRRLAKPFGIYIHDLDKSIWIDAANGKWEETTRNNTRFEMCSQVCWYSFAHSWGSGTLHVSGMYIDKAWPEKLPKWFFFQNLLSTAFFSVRTLKQLKRTTKFLWRKKWGIVYRFSS